MELVEFYKYNDDEMEEIEEQITNSEKPTKRRYDQISDRDQADTITVGGININDNLP